VYFDIFVSSDLMVHTIVFLSLFFLIFCIAFHNRLCVCACLPAYIMSMCCAATVLVHGVLHLDGMVTSFPLCDALPSSLSPTVTRRCCVIFTNVNVTWCTFHPDTRDVFSSNDVTSSIYDDTVVFGDFIGKKRRHNQYTRAKLLVTTGKNRLLHPKFFL
jgi:hypothetical protein